MKKIIYKKIILAVIPFQILISCLANAAADKCSEVPSDFIQDFEVDKTVFGDDYSGYPTPVAAFFRNYPKAGVNSSDLILIAQASLLTNTPQGKMNDYIRIKEVFGVNLEFIVLLKQTAALLGKENIDISQAFVDFRSYGYNERDGMIVTQTAILMNKPILEMVQFFSDNFAYSFSNRDGMIVTQTAALSGRPINEVIQYFKDYPATGFQNYGPQADDSLRIIQTAFLIQNKINVRSLSRP